jgi:hypothetical protein
LFLLNREIQEIERTPQCKREKEENYINKNSDNIINSPIFDGKNFV